MEAGKTVIEEIKEYVEREMENSCWKVGNVALYEDHNDFNKAKIIIELERVDQS